jgi:hypothetical protein
MTRKERHEIAAEITAMLREALLKVNPDTKIERVSIDSQFGLTLHTISFDLGSRYVLRATIESPEGER